MVLGAASEPFVRPEDVGGFQGRQTCETHTVSVGDPPDLRSVKLSATEVGLKPARRSGSM
ncbi:MAG: hypothetical protein JWO38_1579 [Gemmataceae bacterium]|nr:hypothetical protein [Gemmataceae bacterium]